MNDVRSSQSEDKQADVRRQIQELLGELRVALPGVQVLFAFLLTLPFTGRFAEISTTNKTTYFVAFVSAAVSSVLFIAPSAMHRIQHGDGGDRGELVGAATVMAIAGTVALLVTMGAVVFLVTDVLYDDVRATVVAGGLALLGVSLWFALPLWKRLRNNGV